MMSRTLATVDRIATLLLGVLLAASGGALIAWQLGHLDAVAPNRVDTTGLQDVADASWFPWASAATGLALGLIALGWLLKHFRRHHMTPVHLTAAEGSTGMFTIKPDTVASAAAESLAQTDGIASATGKALVDRGTPVILISCTIEPHADLDDVLTAAQNTCAQIQDAVGDPQQMVRIELDKVAKKDAARIVQ
ncbi:hypothetical protein IEU95_01235 [Hoyosella rhizosphaerae]|uniref:Alkaline shock response membrane anchor protein AmaP n=1 Tax=Hoyosella rhizosphaerae TaxID=1755582 RepID=A0A916UKB0_9ACTN|nr:hypothetical protein [Hoyosella rhizosphaerae]MBN4925441.1 hypothetical protein [Hoyosella rhizosphaerae]GGC75175.1 hypothetical protein GCM10011410_30600 [Hoyosella rhizosphaerae]